MLNVKFVLLINLAMLLLQGCVEYGPVDRPIPLSKSPKSLSMTLQRLPESKRIVSLTERWHRGRLAGYYIVVKDIKDGSVETMLFRPATGELLAVKMNPQDP